MSHEPKLTGYGWLIKLPNDELREYATDQEAIQAANEKENEQEE